MTIEKLLTQLRAQRDELDATIKTLTQYVETPAKAEKMVRAWTKPKRGRPRKKLHWTQTSEGKARMSRHMKTLWARGAFKKARKAALRAAA